MLTFVLRTLLVIAVVFLAIVGSSGGCSPVIPRNTRRTRTAAAFFTFVSGPEGASFAYMKTTWTRSSGG